ncbi:MAG: FeS assembly SUF system protein [Alphaproteobacteria bacterium CG_4_10_14_0_8_um_filter_53_9]|nr:MAG: FeS assembly SUF system protein [Alphaproteobacteria bacterium CG_4_10_14_0_8_um_filter_53_9]
MDDTLAADDGRLSSDADLEARIIHAFRGVMDPELPVNIYDLGLIYRLIIEEHAEGARVAVDMTLTAPNCPVAGEMPEMVRQAALSVEGVSACDVALVWDPPWDKSKLSEAVKLELGLF